MPGQYDEFHRFLNLLEIRDSQNLAKLGVGVRLLCG